MLLADQVFTISEYSKKRIASVYNISSDKICITSCAVSKDFINFNKSKTFLKNILLINMELIILFYMCMMKKKKSKSLIRTVSNKNYI